MPYLLIANPSSGSDDDDLAEHARRVLHEVRTVELSPDLDLAAAIRLGLDEERVIVACGGDGTVNAVAQHLAGTDGVMGVLPAGTLNHFARDLGVRDPEVALAVLAQDRVKRVDVGRIGDRVFVNNLGLGVYPALVRQRERLQERLGKWPALAVSAMRVMIDFDPLRGTIDADGDVRMIEAAAVFVGNNRVSTDVGSMGERARLDEGVLDVRVLRSLGGIRGRAQVGWRTLAGPRHVVRAQARAVRITLDRSRPFAVDGEQVEGSDRLTATMDAGSLRVLAPGGTSTP